MILYFADRELNIIGKTSTKLPKGSVISNDKKTEDIETMATSFECDVSYTASDQRNIEICTTPGNYILRKTENDEDIMFQIIDSEKDDDSMTWHIYCADVGMELLNEVALKTEEAKSWTATQAISNTIIGSGYEIGINRSDSTQKLCEFSEQTRSERLKDIADLFAIEIDYRFDLSSDEKTVSHKYIDIYKKRGESKGVILRKYIDFDKITVSKSIQNLATSLYAYGAADTSGVAITLEGYAYDDGDFVIAQQEFDDRNGDGIPDKGYCLQSRNALEKWGRCIDGTKRHITKIYNLDTVDQKTLFEGTLKELKAICDIATNYECDISNTTKSISLGDTINMVDESAALFLSSRVLKIETSVVDKTKKLTLGKYLIKSNGISDQTRQNITQIITTVIGSRVQEMSADDVRSICV